MYSTKVYEHARAINKIGNISFVSLKGLQKKANICMFHILILIEKNDLVPHWTHGETMINSAAVYNVLRYFSKWRQGKISVLSNFQILKYH